MNPVRVQVIARTPATRAGLRALLGVDGLEVIAESTTLEPDVIVTDEASLGELETSLHGPGIVVLSDLEPLAARLLDLEPRGWALVPPDANADELRAAVIAVAHGLAVMPAHLAPNLLREDLEPQATLNTDEPLEELTAREQAVLELLAHGLPNKRIARQLEISESTVKFHLGAIYAKLGVSSRVAAVNVAARHGLVTL